MITSFNKKISFIGAGNVATHLALILQDKGFIIQQIFSRSKKSARELAAKTGASYTSNPAELSTECGLYIISVSDKSFEEVLSKVSFDSSFVVHTSGSIPMMAFNQLARNFGVLYPLQTFSKERDIDFSVIPLCIEANSPENLEILKEICSHISERVLVVNSEERFVLHMAAVFACNFSNHMYALAKSLLDKKDLPFDLLHPIIKETADKAFNFSPADIQTGPAVRDDQNVIKKHLDWLSFYPELKEIYEKISLSIMAFERKNREN